MTTMPLAEIPWADGARVFVFGFGGVFVALAMLAAGVKIVSFIVQRTEAGAAGSSEEKKG
jgi:Na+-transporting methylmalonyl-CoA/oxaloacetate decarboxylase gamma subunit